MNKLLIGTLLGTLMTILPASALAGIDIRLSIPLPPPIIFPLPPAVVVIPEADDVYAVPDIDVDLFFWNGWWWRPWEGRWYRSQYYDRDWIFYNDIPAFYSGIDPDWRGYYRSRYWHGHRWDYERIPYNKLHQNWQYWRSDRRWELDRKWDVRNYQPRPWLKTEDPKSQRQQVYRQRFPTDHQRRPQISQQRQPLRQHRPQVKEDRLKNEKRQIKQIERPRASLKRERQTYQPN